MLACMTRPQLAASRALLSAQRELQRLSDHEPNPGRDSYAQQRLWDKRYEDAQAALDAALLWVSRAFGQDPLTLDEALALADTTISQHGENLRQQIADQH